MSLIDKSFHFSFAVRCIVYSRLIYLVIVYTVHGSIFALAYAFQISNMLSKMSYINLNINFLYLHYMFMYLYRLDYVSINSIVS